MTNKNLSQKICEACRIEPEKDCTNCPHPCETACNNCSYGELVYPDFENKNFAKLFKLITTIEEFSFGTMLCYIPQILSYRQLSRLSTPEGDYESENTDPIKAFLSCVFKCVVKEKDTANCIKRGKWEV